MVVNIGEDECEARAGCGVLPTEKWTGDTSSVQLRRWAEKVLRVTDATALLGLTYSHAALPQNSKGLLRSTLQLSRHPNNGQHHKRTYEITLNSACAFCLGTVGSSTQQIRAALNFDFVRRLPTSRASKPNPLVPDCQLVLDDSAARRHRYRRLTGLSRIQPWYIVPRCFSCPFVLPDAPLFRHWLSR